MTETFLLNFPDIRFSVHAKNKATLDENGDAIFEPTEINIEHPFGASKFFQHGWHSWSPTRWVNLSDSPLPVHPEERRTQADDVLFSNSTKHGGSWVGAVKSPIGKCLLLGALGLDARVECDENSIRGFSNAQDVSWFVSFGDEEQCLSRYATALRKHFGSRIVKRPSRVWSSWNSFGQNISQEILLPTLRDLQGLPFHVFQIDEGWQQEVGDWEPNSRFIDGMEVMASEITKHGFQPGLWLAPLLVSPKSNLFREKAAWLLRDDTGELVKAGHNWGNYTYALNTSLPDVKHWLVQLFQKLRDYGFSYFKLDFLYVGALKGQGADEGLSRERSMRETLTLIRNAVGEDVYLLASGAPILPSLGIVDGLRIAPNVTPYWDVEERSFMMNDLSWPSTRNAIRTAVHRLWLTQLLELDPDVVFFRTKFNLLDNQQKRYLLALAHITKFKSTSDPVEWLDKAEKSQMINFLGRHSKVVQLSRYVFEIDGKAVDFEDVL